MRASRGRGRARFCALGTAAVVLCMLTAARLAATQAPGPATVTAVVAGDGSLTVVWDPPRGPPATAAPPLTCATSRPAPMRPLTRIRLSSQALG